MRTTGPSTATRELVRWRDRDRCRRCGAPTWQIHHRQPRGMGGTRDPRVNSPANLVLLCGTGVTGCHGWVESHRALAREQGWLVSQWADPVDVPIVHMGHVTYLTEQGQALPELPARRSNG